MTHIDKRYYDDAGTDFLKINHTSLYDPGSAWKDYGLYGLDGNDLLIGGHGDDELFGSTGNDTLNGGYGINLLDGGSGTDTVDYSDFGTNTSYTSAYGVTVALASGVAYSRDAGQDLDDTLVSIENVSGSEFADRLYGTNGANTMNGNGGSDYIKAYAGNDIVIGGSGNDILSGGSDNDLINGGSGDDKIYAGSGKDTLTGGTGYDTFYFTSLSNSTNSYRDYITDFTEGVDQIDLSSLNAFEFIGTDSFASTGYDSGVVRYYWSGDYTVVQLDSNGGGTADLVFTLRGNVDLIADDFIF
jgi:Ca2+-binding RTX toxin-like protein